MCVQKALQNQHGSDLIDDLAMAGEGASGGVEMAVGLGGGEAFVPEVDGEGEICTEGLREGLGLCRLRADIA